MDAITKVLYISYDGLTDPLGQSQVLPYLEQLTKQGFHFTILSFEKKERFEKEAGVIRGIIERCGMQWVPLTFTATPPVLSKIWDRRRLWTTALKLYLKNKFHLIHCRSYLAAEAGLKLKRRFGVQILFDMRGFWADEKVDNGQWNLKNLLYKRIYEHYKIKEREFLLNSDGIISLTWAAKDYLLSLPGYEHLPIEVIPCCADLEHFNYERIDIEKAKELKRSLGISENCKVVVYLGSVGGWYMTKEMFLFFKLLAQRYPEYRMLILTKDDPVKIRAEALNLGITSDKIFVTYASRQTLPYYLAVGNFSIFFIRNSFSKIASSPTKHAELMGMGMPVICNDIGDTGNVVRETNSGVIVNNFDVSSLMKVIEEIDLLSATPPEQIRAAAISLFDLKAGASTYLNVYMRLVAKEQIEKIHAV